jgi:hypothetical protein
LKPHRNPHELALARNNVNPAEPYLQTKEEEIPYIAEFPLI